MSIFNAKIEQFGDPESNTSTPRGIVQDYNSIKQQCLTENRLFEDPLFSPRGKRGECVWMRPFEISEQPQFVSSGVSRFDVVQGELGDCWLVAAAANLTLNNKLFELVVPHDQPFERGTYCGIFKFRFWQFGKWVEVVIDDRLPTRNGKLLFMHSTDPDEFWSPLFEKAYAKLHGSYDALRGGTTCEAMVDLTGGLTEFFDIQTPESPADLYGIIKKGFERGSLIGCSIEALDESQRENELPNGLIKGHAYSITSVLDLSVNGRYLPMLRLRNPWSGTSEWNGPWSDHSREWSMIGDYEKQKMGLTFESDGEFWISFHDFKKNFTRVELCNLTPDSLDEDVRGEWHSQMFEGSWICGRTAGGCRNNLNTFAMNPQYVISLVDHDEDDDDDLCTCIVALMQKNKRSAKKYQMGSSELTIGFAIYALREGVFGQDPVGSSSNSYTHQQQLLSTDFFKYNCSVARSPTYINLREVTARFKLPPGTYAIIPSTFDRDEEGEFILRVWTEAEVGSAGGPGHYPDIKPPTPVPLPKPAPRPRPIEPPEPSKPSYPSYPMPAPPSRPDEPGEDKRPSPKPIYPPYPTPGQPGVPGYPAYPSYPSYPPAPAPVPGGGSYPVYPPNYPQPQPPAGGAGDVRYPSLPEEPSIIKRKVIPPPPGPAIDIDIGEVIGTVSMIIGILTMCWSAYKEMTATNERNRGTFGGGGGSLFAEPPIYQAPGYSMQSGNKKKSERDDSNEKGSRQQDNNKGSSSRI